MGGVAPLRQRERGNMRLTLIVAFTALLAFPPPAAPQTRFTFVPSVSIAGVYDDNLFATTNTAAGKMLQVRPNVEGHYESPRLTFLSLYSQDMLKSNFSSLDTLDARRHAFVDTKVRANALTGFGLSAR